MKIGIFGDSFASKGPQSGNDTLSWVEILQQRFPVVDNYALSGSSLFFSYDRFLKHHNDYDKIIFVVTDCGRVLLDQNIYPNYDLYELSINSALTAKLKQENSKDRYELAKVYRAVHDYFLYVQNPEQEKVCHNLMVDNIKRLRPDTFLMPINDLSLLDDEFNLLQIFRKENEYWQIPTDDIINFKIIDRRHCHMSGENNRVLADRLTEFINGTEVKLSINDFVDPGPKEYYITIPEDVDPVKVLYGAF